jgi:hypothetical protein
MDQVAAVDKAAEEKMARAKERELVLQKASVVSESLKCFIIFRGSRRLSCPLTAPLQP